MNKTTDVHYCAYCRKDSTFRAPEINHRKQLILSICTLGFWAPIWLMMTFSKVAVCDLCGNSMPE